MSGPDLFGELGQEQTSAVFSPCRRYRYVLTRRWHASKPAVLWILLNPSTADETTDDPTMRRCRNFSKAWGYGAMVVCNLFAFRATDPADMKRFSSPVGPENDRHIAEQATRARKVVCGWGTHGAHLGRDAEIADVVPLGKPLWCLGVTKAGHPKHPLYLPASTELELLA